MAAEEIEWLSPKQAAKLIGKSTDWLYRSRSTSQSSPPWYELGGRIRYAKHEIAAWIASRRHT